MVTPRFVGAVLAGFLVLVLAALLRIWQAAAEREAD